MLEQIKSKDVQVRLAAIERLVAEAGAGCIDTLEKCLCDEAAEVRISAVKALAAMPQPGSFNALISALGHAGEDVRAAALIELAGLHKRGAVPLNGIGDAALEYLVSALISTDANVRDAAVEVLSSIDNEWEKSAAVPRLIPILKTALKNKFYHVRQTATDVLARIGFGRLGESVLGGMVNALSPQREKALQCLMTMLRDRDADVRQAAAENLGRFGERRAGTALENALDDVDWWVRCAAAMALKKLNWQPASNETQAKWTAIMRIAEEPSAIR